VVAAWSASLSIHFDPFYPLPPIMDCLHNKEDFCHRLFWTSLKSAFCWSDAIFRVAEVRLLQSCAQFGACAHSIACNINRIFTISLSYGGNLTLVASLIFTLYMYCDTVTMAEVYRMAFGVNVIMNELSTKGCGNVHFYSFWNIGQVDERKPQKLLIYLIPNHNLKVFLTYALLQTIKS
jgi:hypothetical protein